jgi:hypothetical protein
MKTMENEKLKLEEIIGYLPFWLNVNLFGRDYELTGITHETMYTKQGAVLNYSSKENEIKLILHPLKDLKKEQLSNFSVNFRMWYNKKNFNYNLMIYSDIELCHKLHVDYRNLIGRGLAIDINTLNK